MVFEHTLYLCKLYNHDSSCRTLKNHIFDTICIYVKAPGINGRPTLFNTIQTYFV